MSADEQAAPRRGKDDFDGFPRGWFVVSRSDELAAGQVVSMRYFGQQLVLYRPAADAPSSEAVVLDAHCPHLGADLGVGGEVVGDTIRCPFHAWRFGPGGRCVEVPYADKIPPKGHTRAWTVRERNGLIFVWHGRGQSEPDYEIPIIEEYGDEAWTDWTSNILTIKTEPREIIENIADRAHFMPVHGTDIADFDATFEEHVGRQYSAGVAYPRGGGKDRFELTATYYGPAYQVTEMQSFLPNKLFNAHTPIDEHTLHLRFGVMLKKGERAGVTEKFAQAYIDNLQIGFGEDIRIWENKRWQDRPTLCGGDGPIGKGRRWYRQFYKDEG